MCAGIHQDIVVKSERSGDDDGVDLSYDSVKKEFAVKVQSAFSRIYHPYTIV